MAGWRASDAAEPAGSLERPRRVGDLRRIRKRALQQHPKLLALSAEIKEARARRALASRERLPKPSLGVSYSREVEADGTANNVLLGTLSLQLPLWQRNRGPLANFYSTNPEENIVLWAWTRFDVYRERYGEAMSNGTWDHACVCRLRSSIEVEEFLASLG